MNEAYYAELRVEPDRNATAIVQSVTAGIAAARARGTRCLLLDLRPIAGVAAPTLARRDAMVTEWARAAAGDVVIAVVAPPELLDPERFGEMIAAAAGLRAQGFVDADAARAWLQGQAVALAPPGRRS
jgi:hypothetical protein